MEVIALKRYDNLLNHENLNKFAFCTVYFVWVSNNY